MKRFAENELIAWKNRVGRKPLIVHGARQVDKTGVKKISFTLLSLPLYLAGQTDRLIREHFLTDGRTRGAQFQPGEAI